MARQAKLLDASRRIARQSPPPCAPVEPTTAMIFFIVPSTDRWNEKREAVDVRLLIVWQLH
jgi:hypothetical protein